MSAKKPETLLTFLHCAKWRSEALGCSLAASLDARSLQFGPAWIAIPHPSKLRFSAEVRFGRFFGRFWTILGGVLGAKIVPKSTKMASVKRFIFHPFSDLRFHRFSTHFWSKKASKIDVFPARKREAQLCKIIDFPLVFVRFWRVGASRIRQKTVAEQSWSLHAFRSPFRNGFRQFSEPETKQKMHRARIQQ